jgi:glycosyltransferase involved in cell wall biosynthesis
VARVASTFWAPGVEAWRDVTVIDRREHSWPAFVGRVTRAARRHDVVVLDGSARFRDRYRDLAAAALIARGRQPTPVVMAEAAWDEGSGELARVLRRPGLRLARAAHAAVRLVDGDHVTYCVFSEEEGRNLARAFRIPPERIEVVRACHTLWHRAHEEHPLGDYVFAGGNSLRDWDTLLAAADGLGRPVRLATTNDLGRVPGNVRAGPVEPAEFDDLLVGAGVVVVPMRRAPRSAGLIVYLNAMAAGKPVIVSDTAGVREYVEHEVTGLVVPPGDPRALREAIDWALDPANRERVDAMRARGRELAIERYSPSGYWARLREVAERAARSPR